MRNYMRDIDTFIRTLENAKNLHKMAIELISAQLNIFIKFYKYC